MDSSVKKSYDKHTEILLVFFHLFQHLFFEGKRSVQSNS